MNTEQIQQLPLDKIKPNPDNRRVGGFDQAKLEQLADSIRAVGVQQPAVVRSIEGNGEYELVAGERRWRAARLAGLDTLPCVIRELDDITVLKISTIENLQREDVHPLDEAEGYTRLIDRAGYDVEVLAKEVGRSVSYVYQRLKLRDLVDAARQALIDGKITSGHAVLIARLQEKAQKGALERALQSYAWSKEPCTVKELSSWIEQNYYLDLQKAAFKKDDATLLPRSGTCLNCPKRTGFAPALFPEIEKHEYCLEAGCFKKKCDAILARQRENLKDEDYLEVTTEWTNTKGALSPYDWEECKKKDEGAKRALVVNGIQRGRLTWGKKVDRSRPRGMDDDSEEAREWREQQEAEETERQKRETLVAGVYEQLVKCYETKEPGTRFDHEIISVFVRLLFDIGDPDNEILLKYGVLDAPDADYDHDDVLSRIKNLPPHQLEMLAVEMLIHEITPRYYSGRKEEFYALAESHGIDVGPLMAKDHEDEEEDAVEEVEVKKVGVCRVCGCTDDNCRQCIDITGEPCHWVEPDLCSACADKAKSEEDP